MLQKVLVVNDNELLLMIATKVIGLAKFAKETITATDGKKALEIFDDLLENNNTQAAPEFIFLDLNMPVMNGWEFLEIFSNNYAEKFPNLKLAILSASVEMKDILLLILIVKIKKKLLNSLEKKLLGRAKQEKL